MRVASLGGVDGHVALLDPEEIRELNRLRSAEEIGGVQTSGAPAHLVRDGDFRTLLVDDQVHGLPAIEGGTLGGIEPPAAIEIWGSGGDGAEEQGHQTTEN